jgi:hypothetical protein
VEFGERCVTCGRYDEVTGVLPLYLDRSSLPISPDGIYQTDLCAGHSRYKSRLIVVGADARKRLVKARLKGLFFEPVAE